MPVRFQAKPAVYLIRRDHRFLPRACLHVLPSSALQDATRQLSMLQFRGGTQKPGCGVMVTYTISSLKLLNHVHKSTLLNPPPQNTPHRAPQEQQNHAARDGPHPSLHQMLKFYLEQFSVTYKSYIQRKLHPQNIFQS